MSPDQLVFTNENGQAFAPVEPTGIHQLFQLAISGKADVAVLEKLMDLSERVDSRNARKAFFDALADFQRECPEIDKSKTAQIKSRDQTKAGFSYKYAPLDAIARAIREPLERHGLSYSFGSRMRDGLLYVRCRLRHVDGHETSEAFPVPVDKGGRMSDAQAHGAALTYGKRQALVAVLGLSTTEDDIDAPRGIVLTEPITADQVEDLSARIDAALKRKPKLTEEKLVARFLKHMKADQLSDILAVDYGKAVQALEDIR